MHLTKTYAFMQVECREGNREHSMQPHVQDAVGYWLLQLCIDVLQLLDQRQ